MANKFFSLIIIPHAKASSRTLTFSRKKFKILLYGTVFFTALLIVFLVDYFTMNVTRAKYRELLSQSQEQKKQIADYESSLGQMKNRVDFLDKTVHKLTVMAGVKSPEDLKEVGVGGGDNADVPDGYVPDSASDSGPQLAPANIQSLSLKTESLDQKLSSLITFYENQAVRLASMPTVWPTRGYVSSNFGMRDDPFTGTRQFHPGIDISTDAGTPVMAPADGVVLRTAQEGNSGRIIVISHGYGITTAYLHLNKFLVRPGQKVKRWDVIGEVGRTGRANGPNLHYEVRINNKAVNPREYILEE
jgi:murein DD-endopeptidase MepM/ murein hydrolase activator NlpD